MNMTSTTTLTKLTARLHYPSPRRRTRGASTLDYVIWTGLFIAFIAGVGAAYELGIAKTNQADILAQYNQLYGATRSLWGSDPNGFGTGDLTQTIIDNNAAPPGMVVGNAPPLVNAVGGPVNVTGAGQLATISFGGLPNESCTRVSALPFTGGAQGGAQAIAINGADQTLPISVTAATTACNVAGQGTVGGNDVTFTIPH